MMTTEEKMGMALLIMMGAIGAFILLIVWGVLKLVGLL